MDKDLFIPKSDQKITALSLWELLKKVFFNLEMYILLLSNKSNNLTNKNSNYFFINFFSYEAIEG